MSEQAYLALMERCLLQGEKRDDRTGVGTYSLFAERLEFDLEANYSSGRVCINNFPLLTTKKVHWKSVILELLWMLRGETNIKTLGCSIWDEWADEDGELGPIYGHQWRNWGGDQFEKLLDGLKNNPNGRRHILSAWNVGDLEAMALPPCHCFVQFYVRAGKFLDAQLYQRSADIFLGVPFNIASYVTLLAIVAQRVHLVPGRFVHTFGDVHLYQNHVEQAVTQLRREVRSAPMLTVLPMASGPDDFMVHYYNPHPKIKAEVAV